MFELYEYKKFYIYCLMLLVASFTKFATYYDTNTLYNLILYSIFFILHKIFNYPKILYSFFSISVSVLSIMYKVNLINDFIYISFWSLVSNDINEYHSKQWFPFFNLSFLSGYYIFDKISSLVLLPIYSILIPLLSLNLLIYYFYGPNKYKIDFNILNCDIFHCSYDIYYFSIYFFILNILFKEITLTHLDWTVKVNYGIFGIIGFLSYISHQMFKKLDKFIIFIIFSCLFSTLTLFKYINIFWVSIVQQYVKCLIIEPILFINILSLTDYDKTMGYICLLFAISIGKFINSLELHIYIQNILSLALPTIAYYIKYIDDKYKLCECS